MRFEIAPLAGESFEGCQALVAAALPPDRSAIISFGVGLSVAAAAWVLTPSTATLTVAIAGGALFALVVATNVYAKARLGKLAAADKHALETHFIELDDNGARTWCNHVDARFPWSDFTRWTENAKFFLLIRPGGSGIAIPKRVVGSAASELRVRLSAALAQSASAQ